MIRFYEGPSATQHYIGKLSSDVSQTYDLGLIRAPVPNEQAPSGTLLEVQPGTEIRLFDYLDPGQGEGYTEIIVQKFEVSNQVPVIDVDQTRLVTSCSTRFKYGGPAALAWTSSKKRLNSASTSVVPSSRRG